MLLDKTKYILSRMKITIIAVSSTVLTFNDPRHIVLHWLNMILKFISSDSKRVSKKDIVQGFLVVLTSFGTYIQIKVIFWQIMGYMIWKLGKVEWPWKPISKILYYMDMVSATGNWKIGISYTDTTERVI